MKRIIFHWTGGNYTPNKIDLNHYHFLIDNKGNIINGIYSIEANRICIPKNYAMHTGGGNTKSIGIAFCGMYNFKSRKDVGSYPLLKLQCEAGFLLAAKLCKKYKIEILSNTVLTHYEFGQKHPNTSSYGKIDISFLPYEKSVSVEDVGNYIRNKVTWYFKKL